MGLYQFSQNEIYNDTRCLDTRCLCNQSFRTAAVALDLDLVKDLLDLLDLAVGGLFIIQHPREMLLPSFNMQKACQM